MKKNMKKKHEENVTEEKCAEWRKIKFEPTRFLLSRDLNKVVFKKLANQIEKIPRKAHVSKILEKKYWLEMIQQRSLKDKTTKRYRNFHSVA